ncbi:MAG: tetratricopeptide repeat protein [Candidatus Eisenbacteria bacterium]
MTGFTRLSRWIAASCVLGMLACARVGAAADTTGGDAAYAQGHGDEARTAWLAALETQPNDLALLTRLARVESELSEDAHGEDQRTLSMAAVEHARTAVRVASDSAQAHVWLAVALGRQAMREGPKTRLALSREIKSEVDRAIALDPHIGRAYHVRAIWNRELSSLNMFERTMANAVLGGVPKGASMDNAVADLKTAVELEPDYVNHRLELGRTYVDLKKYDLARPELEKAVGLPPTSSLRDPHYQAEARELLAKLPKKKD